MIDSGNENLDSLFAAYREATAFQGDASANFMPHVWQKIEARRRGAMGVARFAKIFASAAAALALMAGLYVAQSPVAPSDDTWVETVANNDINQATPYYLPVRLSNTAVDPTLHD